MKNPAFKVSAISCLALLVFCTAPALSQVTVKETTRIESSNGVVTTKKVTSETTAPVIAVPAPIIVPGTTATTIITTEQTPVTTRSETHWTTEEKVIAAPGAWLYTVNDFDLNGDLLLTKFEVGEKLFKMYDTDGNQVIDNNEFERRAVLTVAPVKRDTVVKYDIDGDGTTDHTNVTTEIFMRQSGLAVFDKNGDGLSPREFMRRSFLVADVNNDKAVTIDEWKGSYIASIDKKNQEDARVNK